MAFAPPARLSISPRVRAVFPLSVIRQLLRDYRQECDQHGPRIRRVLILAERAQVIFDVVTMPILGADHQLTTIVCFVDEVQDLLPADDAVVWQEGEMDFLRAEFRVGDFEASSVEGRRKLAP
jgi:hypothetical protein